MTYNYPENFTVKSVTEQYNILTEYFSKLPKLPKSLPDKGDAEGLFVIPDWTLMGNTYEEALSHLFVALAKQRSLKNWKEGKLSEAYLRETELKKKVCLKVSLFCPLNSV